MEIRKESPKQADPGHSIEIQLMGQRIALKTRENADSVREVVDLVSRLLAEAERRAPRTALPQQVALLAILDLAEEYVRAKKRVAEYQSQIQAKSDDLADRLSALNP